MKNKMNFLSAAKYKNRISIILIGALILYSFCIVLYSSILLTKIANLKATLADTENVLATKTEKYEKELKSKDSLVQIYKDQNEYLLGLLEDTKTATPAPTTSEETDETLTETDSIDNSETPEVNSNVEGIDSVIEDTPEPIEQEDVIETPIEEPTYEELLWDDSYAVQLTESERRDFAALIMLESQGESMECKKAVASVVINRMRVDGLSLTEVLYAPGQFEPAPYISSTTPSEDCYTAVDYVCANGPTIPPYVTFFRADYHFAWAVPYTVIDHTFFSYSIYVYNTVMNG